MGGGRLIVSQQLNGWWETDSVTAVEWMAWETYSCHSRWMVERPDSATAVLNGWWETDSVDSS